MTRYIETSPDAFPVLAVELFKSHGKLLIEVPSHKEATLLANALSAFRLKSLLFSPQFLLLERSGEDFDLQKSYAELDSDADIVVTTPLGGALYLPDSAGGQLFRKNSYYRLSEVSASLVNAGYRSVQIVRDAGEFAQRGDILDIGTFIPGKGVRLEFFDDELEDISLFWYSTQRNSKHLEEVRIPMLFFSNKLRCDWQARLSDKKNGIPMQEVLKCEEMIGSGLFGKWDFFPLIAGEKTLWDRFDGKRVRFERNRAETMKTQDLTTLKNERSKRLEEGSFLPFGIDAYFDARSIDFDFEVSQLFSVAGEIEKFPTVHRTLALNLQKEPGFVLNKLAKDNSNVVIFAKPNEVDSLVEVAAKGDVSVLQLDDLPVRMSAEAVIVIEKNAWFSPEAIVEIPSKKLALLSSGIFRFSSAAAKKRKFEAQEYQENKIFELSSLTPGEYVVHYRFGIGVYEGTTRMNGTDCLVLRYEKGDKLYVPVYNMHYIYRYRWDEGVLPKVSSLRNNVWQQTVSRVRTEIEKVAARILELYAERGLETGIPMAVDTRMYREFEKGFPYRETPDQRRSILELENDLSRREITDRLLCGDVGFGKTEVAMRGCMIAVANGMQAVILAPTTVLVSQHLRTLRERFANMPVKIEMLSRLYDKAKQNQVVAELESGNVDIVVGTHRLLGKDVKFKNLGFLVIDEEHRFGVAHKERIKEIKKGIATLSMTATPIPRTLQMSLLGVRKISFIRTAPGDRKSIRTYVLEYSEEIIKDAILTELARDGQVYFVHNRIANLSVIKTRLQQLIPGLRVAIAHGQMDVDELESVMVRFVNREFDLLLATSLIESGIDIPLVNTIIIDRADLFGMAQLYQLRGRVGRWNREAKAFFFVPSLSRITQESYARLAAIKRFDKLGSGYEVAMEDLSIRGGGNILGMSQSGKLKNVGYDTYLEMLKNRIEELKTGVPHVDNNFDISTDLNANIPESYIADTELRIGFYRKIAEISSIDELNWIRSTLAEMFGKIPAETENLFTLTRLKIIAISCGAVAISIAKSRFTITFGSGFIPKNMDELFAFLTKHKGVFSGGSAIRFEISGIDDVGEIIVGLRELC